MERHDMPGVLTNLRILCNSFHENPNMENVHNLVKQIDNCPEFLMHNLLSFILYPVIQHLSRRDLSKDIKLHILDLMRKTLQKIRITKVGIFESIYATLRAQISTESSAVQTIYGYEELKESVMLCLKTMIIRSTTDVIEQWYKRENAPKLAHGIFLCILLARTEKSTSLRLSAIEATMYLMQIHDEFDVNDIVLKAQVADVIMVFLPGVTGGLVEIACGSDTQNHTITMMALKAWGRLVSLITEDSLEQESMSLENMCKKPETESCDILNPIKKYKGEEGVKKLLEESKRNEEWYNMVGEKLKVLIKLLADLARHPNMKVRLELHRSVKSLLFSCTRNLKNCFSDLLEILFVLSEDEFEQVSNAAKQSLANLSAKCNESTKTRPLIETVEENLYSFLTRLPRVIRSSDDEKQVSYLNQLAGYLRFLGKKELPGIMTSEAHLHRLLLSLVYVVELDCENVCLLEDAVVTNVDNIVHTTTLQPWKNFKFIKDDSVEEKVVNICQLLAELGNFELLVDTILKLEQDAPHYQRELMLLLNWVLDVPLEDCSKIALYKVVADQYTSPEIWDVSLVVSRDVNLKEARSNVVQICLLLEGLGVIAKVLNDDQHFLLKILYLVIEKAGSRQAAVRSTGLATLEKIAKSRDLSSLTQLIRVNIDYLTYHITMKLRRIERNPGVFGVIDLLMEHSSVDFLPSLKDIVDDLLQQTNTSWQKNNVHAFLQVFHTFAVCVRKLTEKNESQAEESTTKNVDLAEKVILELLEYVETKKITRNLEEEISEDVPEEKEIREGKDKFNEETPEESEEKRPFFVNMIENVTKRCLHFLPSKEIQVSLLAMSTLGECVMILRDWENVLLPIVHLTWHPLVQRFHHENPLVVNRAWKLLLNLATVSKDFIRSRTLKEVLPPISEFLLKSAKESYKKDSAGPYKFTQIFKLQHVLLSQLGKLAQLLMLSERQQWQILGICEPYLSSLQNPILQECCVELYKDVSVCNVDVMWVKCLSIWSDRIEPISSKNFDDWYFKILPTSNIQHEYHKNLKKVLDYVRERENLMYKL